MAENEQIGPIQRRLLDLYGNWSALVRDRELTRLAESRGQPLYISFRFGTLNMGRPLGVVEEHESTPVEPRAYLEAIDYTMRLSLGLGLS